MAIAVLGLERMARLLCQRPQDQTLDGRDLLPEETEVRMLGAQHGDKGIPEPLRSGLPRLRGLLPKGVGHSCVAWG